MDTDRRVRKTTAALKEAFREIARDTRYRDITVRELTEKADVNRKTFYLHYDSIDDFANTFVDELADQLIKLIVVKPMNHTLQEPGIVFDKVFDFFTQSRDFYTFMITSDDYSFLSRKVEAKVSEALAQAIKESYDVSEVDAYISSSFMIRNTLMLFRLHINGQMKLSRDEFKDRIIRLDKSGLETFLNKNNSL
ncbi:TetR/AcrR family transcriptional regulator [Companilactobacillus hulinensis]|uniref:TetR/AcrR family transcriptional regulator n=1 Tax=Companilactobacillus hulinensis TaxID=2486007 RepID=UPI000F770CC0|nr:TetR/AcrR family transcriptional regulator C-terminal domain-containing protein [Companilactobacillus hulinensis]